MDDLTQDQNLNQYDQWWDAKENVLEAIANESGENIIIITAIASKFGYNTAGFLSYILDKFYGAEISRELVSHKVHGDNFFSCTIQEVESNAFLSRHIQDNIIKDLKAFNILDSLMMGLPQTRHFRINFVVLDSLIKDYNFQMAKN